MVTVAHQRYFRDCVHSSKGGQYTSERSKIIKLEGETVAGWLLYERAKEGSCGQSCRKCLNQPFARVVHDDNIDWDNLKEWLERCSRTHSCVPKPPSHSGIKVIECSSRKIVPLPAHATYAASSYVWGQSPEEVPLSSVEPPLLLPSCIEDALTCVKRLGMNSYVLIATASILMTEIGISKSRIWTKFMAERV